MSKLVVSNNNGNFEGYLNNYVTPITGEKLDFLLNAMGDKTIEKASIKDNELLLFYTDGNFIVIEDLDVFEKNDKYESFILKYQTFIAQNNAKRVAEVKTEPKAKVNRKSSLVTTISGTILALALIGTVGYTVNHLIDKENDDLDNNPKGNIEEVIENAPTMPPNWVLAPPPIPPTPEVISTPEVTPIPEVTPTPTPEIIVTPPVDPKVEFDNLVYNYADSNGVSRDLLNWFLYKNNTYDTARLNHFKTLINYLNYLRNNGYNLEIINSSYTDNSAIYAYDYSKFVIIPENIENMDAIVQLNPSDNSSYYNYDFILNDIKGGNLPNCILTGTANCEVDFENYVNNNSLESIIAFSLNQGVNIQNIGVLGYENSGKTALINAGKVLEDYPNLNMRIVNLDAFYINDYLNDVTNVFNGGYSKYDSEVRALLNSNAKILCIIPHTGGYGISENRPSEALTESMNLASIFNNVYIITTNTANYQNFPNEAYYLNILNYLAGHMYEEELINGADYFYPDVSYNQETAKWEYKQNTYEENDVINDSIYFG